MGDRPNIVAKRIELTKREKVLPDKIKTARLKLDVTQFELAQKLGCSRIAVSMWESNVVGEKRKVLPTKNNLEKLADLLDVPFALLDDEDIDAEALHNILNDKEIDKETDGSFLTKYHNGVFDHALPKNYDVEFAVRRDKKTGKVIKGAKAIKLDIRENLKIGEGGEAAGIFPMGSFNEWRTKRGKSKRYKQISDVMDLYKSGIVKRVGEVLERQENERGIRGVKEWIQDKRIKHGRGIKQFEKRSGLEALLPLVERKIIENEDSYSRVVVERAKAARSYNFWPGVGMLCEEEVPQFQERYGGAFAWENYSMEFDFCCERTKCVARYATLHKHNEIDLMKVEIERMCGQLLVMEKMYGKRLNKYILIYDRESRHENSSKFSQFGPPKWMQQLTQSCKISVLFFSKSKEAVETLLNLVDHK